MEPDLFILGGGVSKEWARFNKFLNRPTAITTAAYLNASGIIGAAYAAAAAWHRQQRAAHGGRTTEPDAAAAGDGGAPAWDPYGEVTPRPAISHHDGHGAKGHHAKSPAGYADSDAEVPVAADPM